MRTTEEARIPLQHPMVEREITEDLGRARSMTTTTGTSPNLLDALITPAELAQKLGVSERTLARWREIGAGPTYVRTGGRTPRYLPSDVDAWLVAQRRGSTAEERAA